MLKIGLVLILFFSAFTTYSQESGLILIDADNQQAFFVRIGDKSYPSSNIGHLAISNLKDSTYLMTIGFPGTQYSEEQFNVRVSKKDQGFQLKLVDGKAWVLYNWQTKENNLPLHAAVSAGSAKLIRGVRMDDPFSKLMAAVVNDTLVLFNNFMQDQHADSAANSDHATHADRLHDSSAALVRPGPEQTNIHPAAEKRPAKVRSAKNLKAGSVILLGNQNSGTAIKMVYVSYTKKGIADTVTIEIPLDSATKPQVTAVPVSAENNKAELNPGKSPDNNSATEPAADARKKLPNTNCKKAASDHEVDQLRVKMMNEYMEDHRIDVIKKFLQSRCMTVKQVKSLAELFSGDKGRYYLYETTYPSVFDPENYNQLAETLLDKEYKDQFNIHFLGQKN
jgi:hypothetical protein